MLKVRSDLVESARFRGGFDQADFTIFGMDARADGFEFGNGWVGAWDNSLADIDLAGLVFTESIQWGIDGSGFRRFSMNDGEVSLMNFPALLHLAQQGGVFFSASHQKEAGGFAVEPADQGQEFPGELFPEPIDQGEGAIGAGRVDQPAGGFVGDEEPGIGADNGGGGHVGKDRYPKRSMQVIGDSRSSMEA